MILKSYQEEALDWLEAFFKRCKTNSNPRFAYEETHLLQGDWRLLDYPAELSETEFAKPERSAQGGLPPSPTPETRHLASSLYSIRLIV